MILHVTDFVLYWLLVYINFLFHQGQGHNILPSRHFRFSTLKHYLLRLIFFLLNCWKRTSRF